MRSTLEHDARDIGAHQIGIRWIIASYKDGQYRGRIPAYQREQGYEYTVARSLSALAALGVPTISASTVRRRAVAVRAERAEDDRHWCADCHMDDRSHGHCYGCPQD